MDVTAFARLPKGIGYDTQYEPLPESGLPPDQVAILFLSQARATELHCPVTPALDGSAAGFADGVLKRCDGLLLRGRRTGHVENFFFQNCAVQIVDPVTE